MKKHVTINELNQLGEERLSRLVMLIVEKIYRLPLGEEEETIAEHIDIPYLIEFIRNHHQMDIYTVNEKWCVQLFDLNVCANDQESCVYENDRNELIDVLFECVVWILDILVDS